MFKIKFVPKLYKICLFLGLVAAVFCGDDLSGPVLKVRVIALAVALAAMCFQVSFEGCKHRWLELLTVGAFVAGGGYVCCQVFMDLNLIIAFPKMLTTACVYFGIFLLIYALVLNIKASAILTLSLAAVISLVEIYVLAFRGTSFKIVDILAIGTAAQVAGEYRLFINTPIISGCIYYVTCVMCLVFGLYLPKHSKQNIGKRFGSALLAILFLGVSYTYATGLDRIEYRNDGVRNHGITLNLLCEFANGYKYPTPENYAQFDIAEVESAYASTESLGKTPHIIVIMDESYADLRVFNGELSTANAVTPFADSLRENTVKGYALTSTLGGGTANSEYEFLTGYSMSFLPYGICPFQHYVSYDSYSLVSYLNSLGYKSIGMHPEKPSNWMRKSAWLNFGIDEVYFIEDYPCEDMIRGKVSDAEYVKKLLEVFEAEKKEQPLFLFGVTIQNHSPYNDASFESTNQLVGYSAEYPEANQYLSILQLSDKALETLVEALAKVEEDVILLVYGDHQPNIESALLDELNGSPLSTLDEREKQYTVPFYIWANFDIPEQTVELTSLNYLSNYLLESAGIPLPAYNQYLKGVEKTIPAINSLGYWSKSAGGFISYAEAAGEEKEVLDEYSAVQYHGLFEKENRSQVFFPN